MSILQGVAATLFIPLEARIFASRRFPEYFYDQKALALEEHIPDRSIREKSSEYTMMASVARYYNMDRMVKAFIGQHGQCNIAYLGAGLETAYHRLDEKTAMFYEVDLPEVIDIRRSVLGEHPNEVLIGGDMFDLRWAEAIDSALPTLILVSGVFQYFTPDKVLEFIRSLKDSFPTAQLIFDAANETGIRYANKYVQKTGNLDALMHFFVNDSTEFAAKSSTTLIEEKPFFTDARKILGSKLGIYTRIAMKVVDDKKRAILLHLKLN